MPSLYGPNEENKEIWVYLEQDEGSLQSVSLEMLSKGRQMADCLGWKLCGIFVGNRIASLAKSAFANGVDEVWLIEHPLLEHFTIEAFSHAVFQALMQGKPSIFLLGVTPNGRDLAARLAVRLRTGLNADCTDLRLEAPEGLLISEVSGFGGGVLALIGIRHHRPQMATVRPGVFQIPDGTSTKIGEIKQFPIDLSPELIHTRIVERKTSAGIDLTRAPVLIAGGRGAGPDFSELDKLARVLGGAVGATRPVVDLGYIDRERQIGQTGVVCSPKLTLCCGTSGAFHFIVGIEKSGTVIAINSDPEAPIFENADYGVVGDVHKIIPALIQQLQSIEMNPHV
jgi:electron transfer flavoprotein alpha subunit